MGGGGGVGGGGGGLLNHGQREVIHAKYNSWICKQIHEEIVQQLFVFI